MSSSRPLIAVTGPHKRFKFGWWATRLVLWLVGARSCYVTSAYPELKENVDGVVIGGGDDIEPEHYGESGDAGSTYDPARDALEIAVIKGALKAGVPIFGICRGAQLLNVVLGGNLYQDIRPLRKQTPNRNSVFVIKQAYIEEKTRLQKIMKSLQIPINSLHSQAVKDLAEPLMLAAKDKDGFTQAFEGKNQCCLYGVQWHPEYLPYHSRQRNLFRHFVEDVKHQSKQLKNSDIKIAAIK